MKPKQHNVVEREQIRNRRVRRWTIRFVSLGFGAVILVAAVGFFFLSDFFVNRYLKGKMERVYGAAHPGSTLQVGSLHYDLWQNRLACDSLRLKTRDSGTGCTIGRCSIEGARWRQVLSGGQHAPEVLAHARLDATDIMLTFARPGYVFHCGRLRASAPDSELELDAVELHPLEGDEQFFASSPYRRTRFRLVVPRCNVLDLSWPALLRGTGYSARSVELHDAFLEALANREKPVNPQRRGPFTPNEALSSIKKPLTVENLSILNGRLNLAQRREPGAEPGVLVFSSVQIFARGISNRADRSAAALLNAEGKLMDAATLKISMAIALGSPELSLHYSGSLSEMDLTRLNPFLEVAGHTRINSGMFQEGVFSIDVQHEHASGQLRAVYRHLDITLLDKQTGSRGGMLNQVESFLTNRFALRTDNSPEISDSISIGLINYTRKPQERFPHFLWSVVREGIFDVLGLSQYLKKPG